MTGREDRPLVKICGIKEEATLAGMNGLPVDYVGFVFAPSKRQVSPERAASLLAAAKATAMADGRPPRAVGVFVNPTMEELANTLAAVKLDVVQLHGDESPEFAKEAGERFGVEVWRALPAEGEAGAAGATGKGQGTGESSESEETGESGESEKAAGGAARLEAYRDAVSAVLIDTAGGGTGRTFRWDLIPEYREKARSLGLKLLVAGGLSPDNVGELLARYETDGVDISSGVETDGVKDNAKIAAFAERVKKPS